MIQCRSAFPPARIGAQLLFHPSILTIENITDIRFPIWRLRGRCESGTAHRPQSKIGRLWSRQAPKLCLQLLILAHRGGPLPP